MAGPPPTGATYSATLAFVICERSGLKRAKPKRCLPVRNSWPDGASTGPLAEALASSCPSDFPFAFGKSCRPRGRRRRLVARVVAAAACGDQHGREQGERQGVEIRNAHAAGG